MKPTKEDLDRFRIEIMTGGRSEDMNMERSYEDKIEKLQNKLDKIKDICIYGRGQLEKDIYEIIEGE